MRYNRKSHESISLFIMLFVYLMTVIVAKNYIFDNILNNPFQKVLAHVSNEYGNITIQAGWDQEPPLVDEINDIVVGVTRASDLGNSRYCSSEKWFGRYEYHGKIRGCDKIS